MDFKGNASCFGELPTLANSPIGRGDGEGAESIDMGLPFGEVFPIEDLSEFSNEDIAGPIPCANISSTLSCASSETEAKHGIWASFACEDLGVFTPFYEGEWLSAFAEDSFVGSYSSNTTNDLDPRPEEKQTELSSLDVVEKQKRVVPRRARSKRARAHSLRGWSYESAPCKTEPPQSQQPRRCTHCVSQRTPQWRAGPLGPKTLCNACGVRFKSGRLFPEYRPAKSPTFHGSIHSNSHKKVLEMRSQLTDVEQASLTPFKVKFKVFGADEFSCGSN